MPFGTVVILDQSPEIDNRSPAGGERIARDRFTFG
jgi:hypothetical protein